MEPTAEATTPLDKLIEQVNESEISSIKSTVSGIVSLINNPRSNVKDLKELLQIDPPLSGKVLRIANSAYYASPRHINELDQAVIWVGYDVLKEIVLSQKVCEVFQAEEVKESFSRPKLWRHSLAVALLTKMIYRREFGERGENAYTAGLLHDLGIIAEDQFLGADFIHVLQDANKNNKSLDKAEKEHFGFSHSEVGGRLVDSWELPQDLVVSIGSHHDPRGVPEAFSRLAKTIYIADYLTYSLNIRYDKSKQPEDILFESFADELKLLPYALESLAKEMRGELQKQEDKGFFQS